MNARRAEAFLAEDLPKWAAKRAASGQAAGAVAQCGRRGDDDVAAGQEAVAVKAASGRGPRNKLPRPASTPPSRARPRAPPPRGADQVAAVAKQRAGERTPLRRAVAATRRGARAGRRKNRQGAARFGSDDGADWRQQPDMVAAGTPARVSMHQEDEPCWRWSWCTTRRIQCTAAWSYWWRLAERAMAAAAPEKQPAVAGVNAALR